MLRGFRRLLRLQSDAAQKIVSLGVGRVVADDRLELLDRQFVFAAAQVNVGQIGPHLLVDRKPGRAAL